MDLGPYDVITCKQILKKLYLERLTVRLGLTYLVCKVTWGYEQKEINFQRSARKSMRSLQQSTSES